MDKTKAKVDLTKAEVTEGQLSEEDAALVGQVKEVSEQELALFKAFIKDVEQEVAKLKIEGGEKLIQLEKENQFRIINGTARRMKMFHDDSEFKTGSKNFLQRFDGAKIGVNGHRVYKLIQRPAFVIETPLGEVRTVRTYGLVLFPKPVDAIKETNARFEWFRTNRPVEVKEEEVKEEEQKEAEPQKG